MKTVSYLTRSGRPRRVTVSVADLRGLLRRLHDSGAYLVRVCS